MTTELITDKQVQFLGTVSQQINSLQALQRAAVRDGNMLAFAVARIKTRHWLEQKISAELVELFAACAGTAGFFRVTRQESKPVLKSCLIDAFLAGLNPVGEEFMIIHGRLFIHAAGYRRMLKKLGVRVRVKQGQAERVRQDRALASLRVEYQVGDGEWQTIVYDADDRISVKLDKDQLDDAILGKAERKALKALYLELSDIESFDADDDVPGDDNVEFGDAPSLIEQAEFAEVESD